jgi:predicted  nucleic acid-binding Zn-ribbon protein
MWPWSWSTLLEQYQSDTAVDWIKSALRGLDYVPDFPTSDDSMAGAVVPMARSRVWVWLVEGPNGPLFLPVGESRSQVVLNKANVHHEYMMRYEHYERIVAEALDLPTFVGSITESLASLLVEPPGNDGTTFVFDYDYVVSASGGLELYKVFYKVMLMRMLTESPYMMTQYREMLRHAMQQRQYRNDSLTDSRGSLWNLITSVSADHNAKVVYQNDMATQEISKANQKLADVRRRQADSENEYNSAKQRRESASNELNEYTKQGTALKVAMGQLQLDMSAAQGRRGLAESDFEFQKGRVPAVTEKERQVAKRRNEVDALQEQLTNYQTSAETLSVSVSILKSEIEGQIASIYAKRDGHRSSREGIQSEIAAIKGAIATFNSDIPPLESTAYNITSQLSELNSSKKRFTDDAYERRSDAQAIDGQIKNLGGPFEDVKYTLAMAKAGLETLRSNIVASKQSLEEKTNRVVQMESSFKNLVKAQTEIAELQGSVKALEDSAAASRRQPAAPEPAAPEPAAPEPAPSPSRGWGPVLSDQNVVGMRSYKNKQFDSKKKMDKALEDCRNFCVGDPECNVMVLENPKNGNYKCWLGRGADAQRQLTKASRKTTQLFNR